MTLLAIIFVVCLIILAVGREGYWWLYSDGKWSEDSVLIHSGLQ